MWILAVLAYGSGISFTVEMSLHKLRWLEPLGVLIAHVKSLTQTSVVQVDKVRLLPVILWCFCVFHVWCCVVVLLCMWVSYSATGSTS